MFYLFLFFCNHFTNGVNAYANEKPIINGDKIDIIFDNNPHQILIFDTPIYSSNINADKFIIL